MHEDINNRYEQSYVEDTNVLVTDIENTYFNLKAQQTDLVLLDKNVLVRKYVFENNNSIDLDVSFVVNSRILSGNLENFGSRIIDNGIIQYNHNYSFSFFSNYELSGHRLNDVQNIVDSFGFFDKDYIGMSNEVAAVYKLGVLKPKEQKEIVVYIYLNSTSDVQDDIVQLSRMDVNSKINEVCKYWKNYVELHKKIKFKNYI